VARRGKLGGRRNDNQIFDNVGYSAEVVSFLENSKDGGFVGAQEKLYSESEGGRRGRQRGRFKTIAIGGFGKAQSPKRKKDPEKCRGRGVTSRGGSGIVRGWLRGEPRLTKELGEYGDEVKKKQMYASWSLIQGKPERKRISSTTTTKERGTGEQMDGVIDVSSGGLRRREGRE